MNKKDHNPYGQKYHTASHFFINFRMSASCQAHKEILKLPPNVLPNAAQVSMDGSKKLFLCIGSSNTLGLKPTSVKYALVQYDNDEKHTGIPRIIYKNERNLAPSEKYSVLCLEAMALIFALTELNAACNIDGVKILKADQTVIKITHHKFYHLLATKKNDQVDNPVLKDMLRMCFDPRFKTEMEKIVYFPH